MIKDANFDIENNANFWKNDIEDLTEKMLQWIKDANCDWRKLILDELLKY